MTVTHTDWDTVSHGVANNNSITCDRAQTETRTDIRTRHDCSRMLAHNAHEHTNMHALFGT